jgi:hypothetical protein
MYTKATFIAVGFIIVNLIIHFNNLIEALNYSLYQVMAIYVTVYALTHGFYSKRNV